MYEMSQQILIKRPCFYFHFYLILSHVLAATKAYFGRAETGSLVCYFDGYHQAAIWRGPKTLSCGTNVSPSLTCRHNSVWRLKNRSHRTPVHGAGSMFIHINLMTNYPH